MPKSTLTPAASFEDYGSEGTDSMNLIVGMPTHHREKECDKLAYESLDQITVGIINRTIVLPAIHSYRGNCARITIVLSSTLPAKTSPC